MITALLFSLVFILGRVEPLPLFLAYALAQMGFWVAPIILE